MTIIGIDPAVTRTGYAVINFSSRPAMLKAAGCIATDRRWEFPDRLRHIYEQLLVVIREYQPDAAALEETIYAQNVQTAIKMGQARGVSLLAAMHASIPIYEYAPRAIKMAVTGNGAASKQQVQRMVVQLLQLQSAPTSLDISDAMAAAICHYHRSQTDQRGVK